MSITVSFLLIYYLKISATVIVSNANSKHRVAQKKGAVAYLIAPFLKFLWSYLKTDTVYNYITFKYIARISSKESSLQLFTNKRCC